MKTQITYISKASLIIIFVTLSIAGCTTYDTVETSAITKSLDFDETDRFAVEVPDTSIVDTAFSKNLQEKSVERLIDELEGEGFDYVGERNPDLRIAFSTYVAEKSGYIDTAQPVVNRVVEQEQVQVPEGGLVTTRTTETVTTTNNADPIYVNGPSRVYLLEVFDADTKALLWRAYTLKPSTGLDDQSLEVAINRLVERLEEET